MWGGLIGLVFLAPLFGMAIGAAAGGASGALADFGVSDRFLKELGEKLVPGSAALIVLVHEVTPDKVLPRIEQYGGEVVQSSLDAESETLLQDALASPQQVAVPAEKRAPGVTSARAAGATHGAGTAGAVRTR